ncbi:MAG: putative sugar O-methyltransferase [Verrucomicrobia bacterium]|nr:putative sugar O-methyltransferase [Verrucomicrobiota bacterium]
MSKKSYFPFLLVCLMLSIAPFLFCDTPVTLSDNRNLTESEIARCRPVIEKIEILIKDRDPNHGTGDNFWTPEEENSEYIKAFKLVSSSENSQILKNLILFCRFFTGFDLVHQKYSPYHTPFFMGKDKFDPIQYESEIKELSSNSIFSGWAFHYSNYQNQLLSFKVPNEYIYQPPLFLGQLGMKTFLFPFFKEIFYNYNVFAYQERISIMYAFGLFDRLKNISKTRPVRILEIGAGYGALAQFIKTILPSAKYTIVDIPESLIYSALYLTLTHPNYHHAFANLDDPETVKSSDFIYVSNIDADKITDSFDLVINTLSMSEMKSEVINWYISLIQDRWIRDGGVFFEENQDNTRLGMQNAQDIIKNKLIRVQSHQGLPLLQGHANVWTAPIN